MITLTTWTGGILTVTGLIGYFATGMESVTSLIPTIIGVLLLIAALVASRVPNASRGVMIAVGSASTGRARIAGSCGVSFSIS